MSSIRISSWESGLLLLLLALGVVLRVLAAQNDLWLDEVLSLNASSASDSLSSALAVRTDNNHFLNTAWMYFLGERASAFSLRALSLLCGALTLFVSVAWCARRSARDALIAAFVFSLSFVLILYSSEARGYSSMLLATVVSLISLERYRKAPGTGALLVFWSACILGLISHFVFLHVYAGLVFATLSSLYVHESLSRRQVAKLHIVPMLAFAVVTWRLLSGLVVLGGPLGSRMEVFINALAVPFGGPELSGAAPQLGVLTMSLAASLAAVLLLQLFRMYRQRDPNFFFFLFVVVLVPVAFVGVLEPQVFLLRYVLPSVFLAYFLFVRFLSDLYARSAQGKALASAMLLAFAVGNLLLTQKLIEYGRGGYTAALRYVSAYSPVSEVLIGGDHDFRTGTLVRFHAERGVLGERIRYVDKQYPQAEAVNWLILESQDQHFVPPEEIQQPGFELARVFESSSLSGARWFLYKRGVPLVDRFEQTG